ncbi:LRR receptor-like serine threonine- kinase GSO1 [Olea europaea subsp. europaea]|uniref:LRR receptor-like serine threonine- kinase GSO1 n=1 Tax=Olea europaea subsp. europaea TaxID=158383 RepID=A0A8S0Q711_OLEEU|nr:LRR receptor-like serine threonine- kinase GSO1 [Olea europaea subsp. europaea]
MYIDLSSNQFNCLLPSLPLKGSVLDFSNNKFRGSITDLCSKASSWEYLDLSNNLLSGQLPDCFANQMSLKFLNLAHNNFSGKIPLPNNISSLRLQNNSFTGEIPASLRNCTSLHFLDLSENKLTGEIPTWVGDRLSKLVLLNLRSNRFFGTVPLNLYCLPRLQVLDISLNKISGAIPKCLSNLSAMVRQVEFELYTYIQSSKFVQFEDAEVTWKGKENEYIKSLQLVKLIDLSSNNLVDEIPPEITSLVGLVGLNLSRNNLSGLLPVKLGQLGL